VFQHSENCFIGKKNSCFKLTGGNTSFKEFAPMLFVFGETAHTMLSLFWNLLQFLSTNCAMYYIQFVLTSLQWLSINNLTQVGEGVNIPSCNAMA
jgi:hypothetical protein